MIRVIIVGGGFAGVKFAQTFRRHVSSKEAEIVLFDQENHMVFHPLLPEVAGGSLNFDSVTAPLRQLLPKVTIRSEAVHNIDLAKSFIEYRHFDGTLSRMTYDHIVLSCGGVVNLGIIPGMADSAFPLKTVGDAMALRNHVLSQLEKAELEEDILKRRWQLSFLVVGGNFSGVEIAGEINDLARTSLRYFPTLRPEDIVVKIIHSRDELLPNLSPSLRRYAREKMEKAGINVVLNSRVRLITPMGVHTMDDKTFEGATVVSTIGNIAAPLIDRMQAPKEGGFLVTDPDTRIQGFKNAWAVGDCAHNLNAWDNKIAPTTGQFAEREGRQGAENLLRVLRNQPTKPFSFKPLGQLCSIGGRRGVAEIFGLHISGFLTWVLWRGIYLFKMPTWSKRIKVGFDWLWELFFHRDLVYVKVDTTERVATAYYSPGDVIFTQGSPSLNFYVIEEGQVEIIREKDGQTSRVALLEAGDYFGQMALMQKRPHSAMARAVKPVRLLVLGGSVFEQLSQSLVPFRTILQETAASRNLPGGDAVMIPTPKP